jgi:C4-dicarboxylate-binding protein DctP
MLKALFAPVLFCALLISPSFAKDWPPTIRLSTQAPPGSEVIQSILVFKERVEALSKGAIRIEIYDSGKLYDSHDIVAAVSSGKIEMGHANLTRYADTVPLADVFSLPFLFSNPQIERLARAPRSEVRRLIEDEILTKSDARVLWWIPEGSFVLLTNGQPMANPAALLGKTVRSSGQTTADALKACGGIPKEIPATKQPEAYKAGEVEIGMTSITAVLARKLFLLRDTITRTNHAFLNDVVVVNESFWRSLSEDQRNLLKSAAAVADQEADGRIRDFESRVYEQLTKQEGARVVALSQDEVLLWRICSSDVLTNFMERTGPRGEDLMAAYVKLLKSEETSTRP